MTPYEIMIAPFEVYLAQVGESFPDINDMPGGNWRKLGTNGKRNMADEGVTVAHDQKITEHRNLGSTGPIKAVRTEEGLKVSLTLEDMTLEQYSKALNGISIGEVSQASGVPGQKSLSLHQGPNVTTYAMLIRGASSYDENLNGQYQIPVCYQSGNPAPKFDKSNVSSLKLEFNVLEDPDAATDEERFGKLIMQTSAAL